jgi:integrase
MSLVVDVSSDDGWTRMAKDVEHERGRVAPSVFPLVLFLGQTGARKSEAINLPWSRVDLKARIVKIWSQADDEENDDDEEENEYLVKSIEREVPISDALFRILAEHKLKCLSAEWVFPVRRGKSKGARYVQFPKLSFRMVVKAAGLTGGPHKFRHSYASNFLARKPDLYLLGRLLGHSHERVTQIYAHLVPGYLEEARNVLPVTIPEDHETRDVRSSQAKREARQAKEQTAS